MLESFGKPLYFLITEICYSTTSLNLDALDKPSSDSASKTIMRNQLYLNISFWGHSFCSTHYI